MTEAPEGSQQSHWLHRYLDQSLRENLCTKVACTTCGSKAFRDGALAALRANTGVGAAKLQLAGATALAKAMAELVPADAEASTYHEPIRCLLFAVDHCMGKEQIAEILANSWAASVLREMRDHEDRRNRATEGHWRRNDPADVARRREEKRRLAQERHLARLDRKKEHDRVWREGRNTG